MIKKTTLAISLTILSTITIKSKSFVIVDIGCIKVLGVNVGWINNNPAYMDKDGKIKVIKDKWGVFDTSYFLDLEEKYFCKNK